MHDRSIEATLSRQPDPGGSRKSDSNGDTALVINKYLLPGLPKEML